MSKTYGDPSMRPRMIIRGNLANALHSAPRAPPSMRPRMIIRGNFILRVGQRAVLPPSMRPRMIIRGNCIDTLALVFEFFLQ